MSARHEVTGKKIPSSKQLLLYFKPDLCRIFKVTPPTLWAWQLKQGFPRAIEVCGKSAWYADEVHQWVRRRPRRKLKCDAATTETPRG